MTAAAFPGCAARRPRCWSGVSPQYYIRLERGDATGVSESVIDGIAHALRLDDAERAHLLDLLRTAGAPARSRKRRTGATDRVRPTIQRLVDAMPTVPAVVLNGRLDVLAHNALGRALFSPFYDTDEPVNNARLVFLDPRATSLFRDWETVANDTVALLRAEAGRDPYDRQLSDLIGELSTRSEDFRVRWAAHDVRIHSTGVKMLHHPVVGDLDLPFESLPLEAGASTSLVTYLPEPGSPTQDALALLASWVVGGTVALHHAAPDENDPEATPAESEAHILGRGQVQRCHAPRASAVTPVPLIGCLFH